MLFTSITFLCFVIAFTLAIIIVPKRYSALVVFASCLLFYGLNSVTHILAMLWVVLGALIFHREQRLTGVLFLLAPLAYFKYFAFFANDILGLSLSAAYLPSSIPPGISFVTFTAITFVLIKPRPQQWSVMENVVHPVNYLLFFPQVIAGPIVRPHELYDQLKQGLSFEKSAMQLGLFLFLLGVLKKFLIADQLGHFVDQAFAVDGDNKFLGVIFFPWQIYFDFSAYTDMALGLAYFFGIVLPKNFNAPYSARSLSDFWRRWHITLSTFFRDYVYKLLGGSHSCQSALAFSLLATFLLSGLWHGANWNFVLWGALNGLVVLIEKFVGLDKSKSVIYFIFVQIIIISLWVVFRLPVDVILDTLSAAVMGFGGANLVPNLLAGLLALVFFVTHKFDVLEYHERFARRLPLNILLPFVITTLICAIFLSGGSSDKFIYFDF